MRGISISLFVFLFGSFLYSQPAQPTIIWDPSPNYTAGRTVAIDSIVIHTTEGSYNGAVSWLKNPSSGASAHYVIREDGGQIKQLVADNNRAWHATYYNNRSIGIECAGFAGQASTWTQGILPALYDLVAWLCYTHGVSAVHPTGQATSQSQQDFNSVGLVGHFQIQPWNRTDPGPHFNWNALVTEVNARLGGGANPNDRIVDNVDPGFSVLSGNWSSGTSASGKYGADYRFASTGPSMTAECEWRPTLPHGGTYEVMVWYPHGTNRAPDAPFTIYHANGATVVPVNQQNSVGNNWFGIGTYSFFTGNSGYVRLGNNATSGNVVIADAVRFREVTAAGPPVWPAPNGLTATALNSTDIAFNWNWVSYADGYWLDIAESSADLTGMTGTFQNANVGRVNGRNWTGLTPGATYYWRVWAYNAAGGAHAYPAVSSITLPTAAPADPATNLAATALSTTTIQFTWTPGANTDGFYLDIAESAADLTAGAGAPTFQNVPLAGTTTSYDWVGLTPGTTYYWRVFSYNTNGGVHAYPTPASIATPGGGASHGDGSSTSKKKGSSGACSTDGGSTWLFALLGLLPAIVWLRREHA
ncbi:MAG: N-acetylmuramoyl-L-alanine amidase [Planctomycetes bacterium]|nr:N-acetylmuramoyl-L-alanine amidase [Planctomycetota bacterium]MCW8136145.1 N-acetylmuramoyl-L-alanine amidase [Planctomycetota bacterium]